MVFHRVVGASREELGDLRPLVADADLGIEEDLVLLVRPRVTRQRRVELVVPPLAALFPIAVYHLRCDESPLLRAVLHDEIAQPLVLHPIPRLPIVIVDFRHPSSRGWTTAPVTSTMAWPAPRELAERRMLCNHGLKRQKFNLANVPTRLFLLPHLSAPTAGLSSYRAEIPDAARAFGGLVAASACAADRPAPTAHAASTPRDEDGAAAREYPRPYWRPCVSSSRHLEAHRGISGSAVGVWPARARA